MLPLHIQNEPRNCGCRPRQPNPRIQLLPHNCRLLVKLRYLKSCSVRVLSRHLRFEQCIELFEDRAAFNHLDLFGVVGVRNSRAHVGSLFKHCSCSSVCRAESARADANDPVRTLLRLHHYRRQLHRRTECCTDEACIANECGLLSVGVLADGISHLADDSPSC